VPKESSTWQEIRALRAAPVGHAAKDPERRAVFTAALRQAEELAVATDVSGIATKPLPLYYCLSQGLRAVAAAREDADNWRVFGHGATVRPVDEILEAVITPNPAVKERTRDALTIMQPNEDDRLRKPMSLGQLWRACPGTPEIADRFTDAPAPLRLHQSNRQDVLNPVEGAGQVEYAVEGLSADLTDEKIAGVLKQYPTLSGWLPSRDLVGSGSARAYVTDRTQVTYNPEYGFVLPQTERWMVNAPVLRWPAEDEHGDALAFKDLAPIAIASDERQRLALPAIGGCQRPHFLPLWLALLLALSSVARYEPAVWTASIDPDSSALAVPIEKLCEEAEGLVARVLHSALTGDSGAD
jgi:hypothetical protein